MVKTYADIEYIDTEHMSRKMIYVTYECTMDNVWQDIKQAISEVINDEYHEGITLTYKTLYDRIVAFDGYEKSVNQIDYHSLRFGVKLSYLKDEIIFEAWIKGMQMDYQRYVINSKEKDGNCVDDFLRRGVVPLVTNINDCVNSIKSRVDERKDAVEYHRTWCYEKDFTQVSMIKKYAQKIIENCDKHLERISEFYTRL